MEYEIKDEPQGIEEKDESTAGGGLVEDHIALKNQSSVSPDDYPRATRRAQSLVRAKQEK